MTTSFTKALGDILHSCTTKGTSKAAEHATTAVLLDHLGYAVFAQCIFPCCCTGRASYPQSKSSNRI